MKGQFICFEGIDGAGKSTVAKQWFERRNIENGKDTPLVFVDKKDISSIPSDFVRGQLEHIKAALWDYPKQANISQMGDYHWLLLLGSWFSTLSEAHIEPLLEQGNDVIVDSWLYKFQVRFSMKEQFGEDIVTDIFKPIRKPDRVILLDTIPEIAFSRRTASEIKPSEAGRCDGEQGELKDSFINYQSKVRELLIRWSKQDNWTRIDSSTLSIDEVVEQLQLIIPSKLG